MNLPNKIILQGPLTERGASYNDGPKFKIDLTQHLAKSPGTYVAKERSTSNKLMLKKKTISRDLNIQTSTSARLNIQTSSSPIRSNVQRATPQEASNEIQNTVFANLYDKIMNQNSQHSTVNIYSNVETPMITPRVLLRTNSPKVKLESARVKHIRQKTIYNFEASLSPIKGEVTSTSFRKVNQTLELSKRGKSSSEITAPGGVEDRYKFSRADSKYVEIVDLKTKNEGLMQQNKRLKQDIAELDNLDELMRAKVRPEDFNEKRCDMLKFCVKKQKAQISDMSRTIRLCHTFYKDLQNVLNFLIEMNEKYVKARCKFDEVTLKSLKAATGENDVAYRGLSEIYQELGNTEAIEKYLINFNEAYSQVKDLYQGDAEMRKLFNIKGRTTLGKDELSQKPNEDTSKKVKYNFVLKQFIKKHKKIFPLYTVFDNFELKDQQDLSAFLEQIISMSNRINYNFNKMKNTDLLKQTAFIAKNNISKIVSENQQSFEQYFNSKNPNKRIILDSDQVLQTEKSLASLLNELTALHSALSIKKDVSLEDLSKIQEALRSNIEQLLLLGVAVNNDKLRGSQILLAAQDSPALLGDQSSWQNIALESSGLIEIYNHDAHNLIQYDRLKSTIKETLEKMLNKCGKDSLEDVNKLVESLKIKIGHLERNFEEKVLVSQLKDREIKFLRDYTQNLNQEIVKIKTFATEKFDSIKTYLQSTEDEVQRLEKAFDLVAKVYEPNTHQDFYQRSFRKCCVDLKDNLHKFLSEQKDFGQGSSIVFGDAFRAELNKVKRKIFRTGSKPRGSFLI